MKKPLNRLILTAAAAAVSALLLAGCQEKGSRPSHSPAESEMQIQAPAYSDTTEMDEETRHRIILIKSASANGCTEK